MFPLSDNRIEVQDLFGQSKQVDLDTGERTEMRYAKGGKVDEYYSKMIEKLGKKGAFERVLKDSQFANYKGTPSNEFKHNRLPKTAIIGKNSVSITSYTPNTKRFLDSQTFTSPKELAEYLDKNQIYEKGGYVVSF